MESMISRLQLLSGTDLSLTSSVKVKHPTISDILAINDGFFCEDYYWAYVSSILSDPYDHMVYLDDRNLDFETTSAFQVFLLRWAESKTDAISKKDEHTFAMMSEALTFYFGEHDFDVIKYNGVPLLVDNKDNSWFMTEELFTVATQFIMKMNCFERTDKIKPANAAAKRILIDDMRIEQRKRARNQKKEPRPNHLGDALAVVLSGGAGAITPSNYHETHIYQLLTASRAIQKQMVVQSMLNGIYTGMIKAEKISDEELRWV